MILSRAGRKASDLDPAACEGDQHRVGRAGVSEHRQGKRGLRAGCGVSLQQAQKSGPTAAEVPFP